MDLQFFLQMKALANALMKNIKEIANQSRNIDEFQMF